MSPRGKDPLTKIRRAIANAAVRGRRRLVAESNLLVVETRPMLSPDGVVVNVPMGRNDYCRFLAAKVFAMSAQDVVWLARRKGLID